MEINHEIKIAERNFNDLLNNDENIRLKAAKYFSWLARNEYSNSRKEVFDDKETYEKLYPLLNDENKKVVCEIVMALGCGYRRYNAEPKIVDELLKLYDSKDKNILYYTIIWTVGLENEEMYNKIFALLEKEKSKKMIQDLFEHFSVRNTDENIRNRLQKILLEKIKTIKNNDVIKIIEDKIKWSTG